MIVELDTVGISHELVVGVLEAFVRHNARWFMRERARGRYLDDSWLATMRYDEPPVLSRLRLRDAGRLLAEGKGGCGELAALVVGWNWAIGRRASLDAFRRTADTWHAVAQISGRGTWDPERRLLRAA